MRIVLLVLLIFCLIVPSAWASAPDWGQPVFGVVDGSSRPGEASALGVGWERAIFHWNLIQPNPDSFNADAVPEAAIGSGRQVVGLVKGTPPWASTTPSPSSVPVGLDLPYNDPGNVWGAFVTQLVTHFSGRGVHHWIVWNEPDIRPGEGSVEFEGDVADYHRLLAVFYQAARAVDPGAHIQIAGMSWWHDQSAGRAPYLQRLLQSIIADPAAAANNFYFDGITLHIYFTTSSVVDIVRANTGILNRFNQGEKQVWLTEFNASPRRDPAAAIAAQFNVSLEQQADFIVQASAIALAEGVDRMSVYKMYDDNFTAGISEPWGLVRADGSLRPAFEAYRQVIGSFTGAQNVLRYSSNGGTLVVATFPDHTVYGMWSDTFNAGEFLIGGGDLGTETPVFDAARNPIVPAIAPDGSLLIEAPGAERIDASWVVVAGPVRLVTVNGPMRPVRFRSSAGGVVQLN
jgi:hypothetical protein